LHWNGFGVNLPQESEENWRDGVHGGSVQLQTFAVVGY